MTHSQRTKQTFTVSCDALKTARYYGHFLREYSNQTPPVTNIRLLRRAALRYEHCWLPLVATKGDTVLFPPWDVYYVWHLHMLLPQNYRKYCHKYFGRTLGHTFLGPEDDQHQLIMSTKSIWQERHPLEPYEMKEVPGSTLLETRLTKILCESDVNIAHFHHQLTAEHYQDDYFLQSAQERYCMFMNMIKQRAGGYIPTTDIELLWKSHMLNPVAYTKDSLTFFGRIVDMDSESYSRDSIDGPRFVAGIQGTAQRWKEMYKTPYVTAGTVTKDLKCYEHLHTISPDETARRYNNTCEFVFNSFFISLPNSKKQHVNVVLRKITRSNHVQELFKTTAKIETKVMSNKSSGLCKLHFDPKLHKYLAVYITSGGSATCSGKQMEFEGKIVPQDDFTDDLFYDHNFVINLDRSENDPNVELDCTINVPSNAPSVFTLDRRGSFKIGPVLADLEHFVNIPSWHKLDITSPISCFVAEHRLVFDIIPTTIILCKCFIM